MGRSGACHSGSVDWNITTRSANCRGGPPWPPVVSIRFTESEAVTSLFPIKTTGGHGGPPLQFAEQILIPYAANLDATRRRSAIVCFGCAPIRRSISFPSLKMSIVGMLEI